MIGQNLQSVRRNFGWSQAYVAGLLEVPVSTYASWEQDKSDPPLAQFVKVADCYRLPLDALAGRHVEDASGLESAVALLSPDQKSLLARFIVKMSMGGGINIFRGALPRLVLFCFYLYYIGRNPNLYVILTHKPTHTPPRKPTQNLSRSPRAASLCVILAHSLTHAEKFIHTAFLGGGRI